MTRGPRGRIGCFTHKGSMPLFGRKMRRLCRQKITEREIDAVRDHLHLLRVNNLVPTRRDVLGKLLESAGALINETNIARTQDLYFRGMYIALRQSERRYGGYIVEADDVADAVVQQRARTYEGDDNLPSLGHTTISVMRSSTQPASVSSPFQSDGIDDRFETMANLLVKKRSKSERWSDKSKRQAEQTYSLLAKFMREERGIEYMHAVRQKDLMAAAGAILRDRNL